MYTESIPTFILASELYFLHSLGKIGNINKKYCAFIIFQFNSKLLLPKNRRQLQQKTT